MAVKFREHGHLLSADAGVGSGGLAGSAPSRFPPRSSVFQGAGPAAAPGPPAFLAFWVLFCASLSAAGWVLSALHWLTPQGYTLSLALGATALAAGWRRLGGGGRGRFHARRVFNRFRRGLPLSFLILAGLAALGGLLYAPTNYDALAYRLPRVLHWLAEGRWHWIHTEFNRVNTRGCGFEWLSAPVLALAKTERPLFLYSLASFCLLPGLIFSSFHRLGVRPRVAYAWMWILPGAYGLVLQAGSIANDLFAATLFLAAIDLALRARASRRLGELWLSLLAVALSTGVKANVLSLGLVWVAVAVPAWRCFLSAPAAPFVPRSRRVPLASGWGLSRKMSVTLLIGAVGLGVSYVPTGLLNWRYGGEWTGTKVEKLYAPPAHPVARALGNAIWIVVENFAPPIAPFARAWDRGVAPRLAPTSLRDAWQEDFGSPGAVFCFEDLQIEENSGLGLGVSALLVVSALVACRRRGPGDRSLRLRPTHWLIAAALTAGLLAIFRVSTVASLCRLAMPGYLPLAALLLVPAGQEPLVRGRAWRRTALAVSAVAGLLVILTPARPLFPTALTCRLLRSAGAPEALVARVELVYGVYACRSEALTPAVALLPPGEPVVGMVTYDDPETSLWKPFGGRRVVHVCLDDRAEAVRGAGVRYVWVSGDRLERFFRVPLDQWLQRFPGRVRQTVSLNLRADYGARPWYLIELIDPNEHSTPTR